MRLCGLVRAESLAFCVEVVGPYFSLLLINISLTFEESSFESLLLKIPCSFLLLIQIIEFFTSRVEKVRGHTLLASLCTLHLLAKLHLALIALRFCCIRLRFPASVTFC
ncbi:hypothetical protein BDD12DRAFT_557892 [Trichophaea hybrida]|nr:hypothetical protein BDD12DRAFT_557892 [Trichophaea hybrida]